jgi:hypothetical protein
MPHFLRFPPGVKKVEKGVLVEVKNVGTLFVNHGMSLEFDRNRVDGYTTEEIESRYQQLINAQDGKKSPSPKFAERLSFQGRRRHSPLPIFRTGRHLGTYIYEDGADYDSDDKESGSGASHRKKLSGHSLRQLGLNNRVFLNSCQANHGLQIKRWKENCPVGSWDDIMIPLRSCQIEDFKNAGHYTSKIGCLTRNSEKLSWLDCQVPNPTPVKPPL